MGGKQSVEEVVKGQQGYDCFYETYICKKDGVEPLFCVSWMD